MNITEPCCIDMPAEEYHRHPALSSTGARLLVKECEAVFAHERENPVHRQVFDIGTASHLMILEPETFASSVVIIQGRTKRGEPSDGYSTQDARDQRDEAYAAGKTPLLPEEAMMVRQMRDALRKDPMGAVAFTGGKAEQSIFWRDPEFGIQRRARLDYMPNHSRYICDYKSSISSNPEDIRKAVWNFGYHMQSSWYLDGVEAATGLRPERFAFLVQSKKPPHLVTTVWMGPRALAWGAVQNRYACGLFARAQERQEWLSYRPDAAGPPAAFTVELPAFAERELQERFDAGGFDPPRTETSEQRAA